LPYILAEDIEKYVAEYYRTIRLTKAEADQVRQALQTYIRENSAGIEAEAKRQRLNWERLEAEHAKLLAAYYAGMMPMEIFGREQERILTAQQLAKEALASAETGFDDVQARLERALDLMQNMARTYREASKPLRRKLNQAFFAHVFIDEDESVMASGSQLANPFGAIMSLAGRSRPELEKLSLVQPKNQTRSLVLGSTPVFYADGSKENNMVELKGLSLARPVPPHFLFITG
jgi:hypothetical protein